jgi:hypothetical protein
MDVTKARSDAFLVQKKGYLEAAQAGMKMAVRGLGGPCVKRQRMSYGELGRSTFGQLG